MGVWKEIWTWLWTWKGLVPAGLAVAATLYYGPQKVLEAWDWYCDRFRDNEVFFLIIRRKFVPVPRLLPRLGGVEFEQVEIPYQIKEMADYLHRTEKSISRSLQRLRRRGKIEPHKDGWRARG